MFLLVYSEGVVEGDVAAKPGVFKVIEDILMVIVKHLNHLFFLFLEKFDLLLQLFNQLFLRFLIDNKPPCEMLPSVLPKCSFS